ncbi:uncharacterized protein KY384_002538 [Bacidia gigantensis]|uniref:uncharacterized protein n=1 Tax=Bacidia gigantensis TaxID=2732470 RepID=UPI001D03EBF8|nr:uncharacterized protein KY384_002538 [Bacidia gigantensis]KAG8532661.1 hypothetical protein KY384_002538 [Bacidia gigantensis]
MTIEAHHKRANSRKSLGNDDSFLFADRKLVLAVDTTKEALLEHEDLDGDGLITVEDTGPKVTSRILPNSPGNAKLTLYKCFVTSNLSPDDNQVVCIKGNYALANLLQELFLAEKRGQKYLEVNTGHLSEDPIRRLERLIKGSWWDNLTRTTDAAGVAKATLDSKTKGTEESPRRIYIPSGAPEQYTYFKRLSEENPSMHLDVQKLPDGGLDSDFIHSLNAKPGLLALDMKQDPKIKGALTGTPFIVPGGRFNELYYWDTAFCAWGMMETHVEVVKSIIKHFVFEIKHYGKICNANRSYYLGRSQPPFLTDLALRTYKTCQHEVDAKDRLRLALLAAIKEYNEYWMAPPRHDISSGLNTYRPIGVGFPPECELGAFNHILAPYAKRYDINIEQFITKYDTGEISEAELDTFFLHDRAVRECGHDTSNRVESVCADMGTIDLQCLLYKYEKDIAWAIRSIFDDQLSVPADFSSSNEGQVSIEKSAKWDRAARKRKESVNQYCWNEEKGMYFDFNIRTRKQSDHESVTMLWPLWCGIASAQQAGKLVEKGLPHFECIGGLSSTTEKSRGLVDDANPQKQWDYPHGWPPHQMLAWEGLKQYGYHEEAERLIYRWLHMVLKVFVDYNGTVVEKYNVTTLDAPQKVDAEYGNQGLNFKYAPQEG